MEWDGVKSVEKIRKTMISGLDILSLKKRYVVQMQSTGGKWEV